MTRRRRGWWAVAILLGGCPVVESYTGAACQQDADCPIGYACDGPRLVCAIAACLYADGGVGRLGESELCKSDDATLSALTISPGSLPFEPLRYLYTVDVPASTTSVTLDAVPSRPGRASVALHVGGVPLGPKPPTPVPLTGLTTTVQVIVTADSGRGVTYTVVLVRALGVPTYLKASNNRAGAEFGLRVALDGDAGILAVGAPGESGDGHDGDQSNTSAPGSGAVYVFYRRGRTWEPAIISYLKAPDAGAGDGFGLSLALSADGSTLAAGAPREASGTGGINGAGRDDVAPGSGAVYVFSRSGTAWSFQASVKAAQPAPGDQFFATGLSRDGNLLAVGAPGTALGAGVVALFTRTAGAWTPLARVTPTPAHPGDQFGAHLALSAEGTTLAVGAALEASTALGVNGAGDGGSSPSSGAAYVFSRADGGAWTQEAYLKSRADGPSYFGTSVALSADGTMLAVGAPGGSSVEVFQRLPGGWASVFRRNGEPPAGFGASVALSADGTLLAVSNPNGMAPTIVDGGTLDAGAAGVVSLFVRSSVASGVWDRAPEATLHAPHAGAFDRYGWWVALSGDGATLASGAPLEDGDANGLSGLQGTVPVVNSGAAYVYSR